MGVKLLALALGAKGTKRKAVVLLGHLWRRDCWSRGLQAPPWVDGDRFAPPAADPEPFALPAGKHLLCSCGRSRQGWICDGAHLGTGLIPHDLQLDEPTTVLMCRCGQGSLVGMERFAKRHRQTHNELLGTDFGKSPSEPTFRLLLAQLDVPGFDNLLRDWMAAQPAVTKELDTLVCDGKTLRGSIAQTTDATDTSGEIQTLRQLLEAVDLEGVPVQADALHANRPFSSTLPSAAPTS